MEIIESLKEILSSLSSILKPRFRKIFLKNHIKIHRSTIVQYEKYLQIGKYVYIGRDCVLNAEGTITVGDGTIIAPQVVILSSSHDYKVDNILPYDVYDIHRPVRIGRGVWIGYGSMICPGVEIGDGAVVAMGSVVVKDVKNGEIVGGNPATPIGRRTIGDVERNVKNERYFHRVYWNKKRVRKVSLRK
jgi:acetyltransferase-like isoleucine patch superfamily enzyme